jgi:CO/xanthine dehydrogenase Mo-binding subunit
VLADGKVRHVGDAYRGVVAETVEQARDAAEAIEADIDRTARHRRHEGERSPTAQPQGA